jgi:hypothetical protein
MFLRDRPLPIESEEKNDKTNLAEPHAGPAFI